MKPGLYEQIINKQMNEELASVPEECRYQEKVDSAEASRVLATYAAELMKRKMDAIYEASGDQALSDQIAYINKVIGSMDVAAEEKLQIEHPGEQLLSLLSEKDEQRLLGRKAKDALRPETSMAYSSLFTGAAREPQMLTELKKEIVSADRIDMLVSFIKWSGLRELLEELRSFTAHGGRLRVICTSYMGATDVKAVEELDRLPNTEIKISYDTKRTRLHAKSYIFYRDTGFTTAYIGSSNMSNAALTSGLEWNVKAAEKDMADTIEKVRATFASYWNDSEFVLYDASQRDRLIQALRNEKYVGEGTERKFVFDIRPYAYQQEILDKLEVERQVFGHTRNLVVAATGCGKTVISAFDYARFCKAHPGEQNRLLFVAHREEILEQSIETFRGVLHDLNFGDLWVGSHKPEALDHLFVSIQTLNSTKFYQNLPKDYYDFIVVDEFHHAAAAIYQEPLHTFDPKILLGLTATPERMDGEDIHQYFGGRIAAEICLPEAIDRKLLCPFQYFGVSDTVDLKDVRWVRGGYDRHALSDIYSLSGAVAEKRAQHVIANVEKYNTSVADMKGFVSVPKGCYIYLEKKASEYVLQNIRSSIETRNGIVAKIASYEEDTGKTLTLGNFLDSYRMDPRAIYKKNSFARLCVYAGVKEDFEEPEEKEITKALARLASIDSRRLLQFIIHILPMLDRLDFDFACPIDLHCTYSRDQLLVALDFMKPSTVREGVKWLPEKKLDVLFVTLNKSDKDYSPTTMYQDYSINKTLFHWQSQSTTSDRSKTGQRYIHHRAEGSRILLCVRDAKKDAWGGTASYSVLGFVDYVQHTGSNPMSITWRLAAEIPAKYIRQTNKLIVS